MEKTFQLDEVRGISGELVLVETEEIDVLEKAIWFRVPKGYREFMSVLGNGILDENIRIDSPKTILKDFAAHSQRMRDYWFWGEEPISQQMAIQTIPVGGTLDGDSFVVHPGRPDEIFVLPSESDIAIRVNGGLLDLIEWIRESPSSQNRRRNVFEPVDDNPRMCARLIGCMPMTPRSGCWPRGNAKRRPLGPMSATTGPSAVPVRRQCFFAIRATAKANIQPGI